METVRVKALVTGGAGFIGSNVAKLLLDEGHAVVIVDNLSSGYEKNLRALGGSEFIEGDVTDLELLERMTNGVDVVFHLAASVGNTRSIEDPLTDAKVNVIGTLNVLEAARKAGCRRVIYSSSAGIFGELKTLPIREDHQVEPDSPYGATKLGAEKLCLAYSKLYPLEAVCLRYFNVYGPNQRYDAYGNAIPIFVHQMLGGNQLTIFGDGEQTRDLVNVKDVARANIAAGLARELSGAFNIASGESITINALVNLLCEVSGLEAEVVHGPRRPGDVRHSLAELSKAREAFSYNPIVPIREGLQQYVEWVRQDLVEGL
jgi:UDP-glucose 4-epimerase